MHAKASVNGAHDETAWPPRLNCKYRGLSLIDWCRDQKNYIAQLITEHGAVLIPQLKINNTAQFQKLLEALWGEGLLEYKNCSTPRKRISGSIYTSTEYPPNERIPLHSENAYSHAWPRYIGFLCLHKAESGGITPIADCRRVYNDLPDEIKESFEKKGVMYVRNYGLVDLTWQEVFGTNDKDTVEQYCESHNVEYHWGNNEKLSTREVRQSVVTHPLTKDKCWFNQAHLFHISANSKAFQEELLDVFGEKKLPRNCYYGDGSPINASHLDMVRDVLTNNQIRRGWHVGDMLLMDNMLCAHGREEFSGKRKIAVGMARECDGSEYRPGKLDFVPTLSNTR